MSEDLNRFITGYLWGIFEGIFFSSMFVWFISVLNNTITFTPFFEYLKWTPEMQKAADNILDLFGLISSITFWSSLFSLSMRWIYRLMKGYNKFVGKI